MAFVTTSSGRLRENGRSKGHRATTIIECAVGRLEKLLVGRLGVIETASSNHCFIHAESLCTRSFVFINRYGWVSVTLRDVIPIVTASVTAPDGGATPSTEKN